LDWVSFRFSFDMVFLFGWQPAELPASFTQTQHASANYRSRGEAAAAHGGAQHEGRADELRPCCSPSRCPGARAKARTATTDDFAMRLPRRGGEAAAAH
jgi:hypothetical protein